MPCEPTSNLPPFSDEPQPCDGCSPCPSVQVWASPPLFATRVPGGYHVSLSGWPPLWLRRFELTESLDDGGPAEAEQIVYDGSDWIAGGRTMTVVDSLGTCPRPAGTRGFAALFPDSRKWEIIAVDDCPDSNGSGESSSSGQPVCVEVVTGLEKIGSQVLVSRKTLCLPPETVVTDLPPQWIEICCPDESSSSTSEGV